MSVVYSLRDGDRLGRVHDTTKRLYALLFGDRLGVTVFLGSLAFLALYWRVGVFITDNWTVANTMVAVADGHLHVDRIVYGPGPNTPGMHLVDGRLYGRNYGHVVAALPFVWLLQGLAWVADLRVAVAGLWSLLLLGFAVNLGSLVALGAFVANVALATPLPERWIHLLALQSSTLVATAFLGVVLYRLGTRVYDRRVGLFAGGTAVLATSLGFWASIPKRHVVTALLLALVLYSFYRSREEIATETRYRALAYVWVGLLAWVHAPEALAAFVALVVVDVPTARTNDARTLSVVGGAFLLSLAPFFLTNQLIAGNPVEPPRLLPSYGGGEDVFGLGDAGSSGAVAGGGGAGSSGGSQLLPPALATLFAATVGKFTLFASLFTEGAAVAVTQPDRLYHTFVHSGYIPRVAARDGGQAINLALVESMPLLAALAALPALAVRAARDRPRLGRWLTSPAGQTDLLVGAYAMLVTLIYLPRLPLHAMVTVRYLVPLVPGLVYLLVRLSPVRRAVRTNPRPLLFAYAASVLIGGQVLLLALLLTAPSRGEAVQLHAWLGLATAVPLGAWALVATATDREAPRVGAVLLGLAAGTTTVFLLLSGLVYFAYAGDFALPLSQRVSEALALL